MLTNFSGEFHHLVQHSAIPHFEHLDASQDCASLTELSVSSTHNANAVNAIDVSWHLAPVQKESLLSLLHLFKDCFASTS